MPDKSERQKQTGSRDDLQIEPSRCLRIRFSDSSCERCRAICPAAALSLEEGLAISHDQCSGCLLCTTVCPSGAVEQQADFQTIIPQLRKVPEPVLGCCRTREQAHAWLPCLGGLAEEHLLALCRSLSGTLTLNLAHCNDCPNNSMLAVLKERLQRITASGLTTGGCELVTATAQTELQYQPESVDRRSFFRSFRNSLFQAAAEVVQSNARPVERNSSYGDKRLPQRRELLNRTRRSLPEEIQAAAQQFDHNLSFNTACSACQGCAAICPTGALVITDQEEHPAFLQERCTGCGLCVEFCLDQAISL
ncbi:4Fe-4S binding protein [Trichlorobacter lovleyi]|uniref:4Fe-4S dicluster domain-containing protein n=1 Tax=Trichlorobacter lovleyi TaxID=313985 RepID=UPI00223ECD86|nr:4Fe-4S dicluster domain-containing protein [Trichlorobacter lovleyi]QOX78307.1 4Fe-4S binding protein [Trichlorobacter lovleyi]